MIALVPLSRFRITYEAACGRPYSKLEHLVLRAIGEGAPSLEALRETFRIHPRLLIEALVTLTQAGWLAVGSVPGQSFVLTAEGQQALASGSVPTSLVIISRWTDVILERITGGLVWHRDIRYVSEWELKSVWDDCFRLNPRGADSPPDEGKVQHLLPRAQEEWIRWIGPIDLSSRDAHWLQVNVDLTDRSLVGLPDAWKPRLQDLILAEAQVAAAKLSAQAKARSWNIPVFRQVNRIGPEALQMPQAERRVRVTQVDLLFTAADHQRYYEKALTEARSGVFIASAFVTAVRLEATKELLLAALKGGVNVDLLWGYSATGEVAGRDPIKMMTSWMYEAKKEGWPGKLRFTRFPSHSHTKLLLWDSSPGRFEGCVGSHNWLSAAAAGATGGDSSAVTDVSVRVDEPGTVAQLGRCAAALWAGTKEVLSSVADRWRRIAGELDRIAAIESAPVPGANATVRLILDREHEMLLRTWLSRAQTQLLVASHQLGPAADARLVAAENRARGEVFQYTVLYGRTELDSARISQLTDCVQRASGKLCCIPELHAKVLVCDQSACVSSYNFLSADPYGTAVAARELGIVFEGPELAHWLASRLGTERGRS